MALTMGEWEPMEQAPLPYALSRGFCDASLIASEVLQDSHQLPGAGPRK